MKTSLWPNRIVFLLSAVGLVVAGYLWFLHATYQSVPCGGSHDCATVAESPYAQFPMGSGLWVAMWGTLGYAAFLILSLLRTFTDDLRRERRLSTLVVAGATAGMLFSLYLTFVEGFILHAWCRWCLTSQAIMALVFLISGAEWLRARAAATPPRATPLVGRDQTA